MKITRIKIKNFRCIKESEIICQKENVFLGPNNSGKTAILESLNLLLNPEATYRSLIIDENDFYNREYVIETNTIPIENPLPENEERTVNLDFPKIFIETVISDLSLEDEDLFRKYIVPWDPIQKNVIESAEEDVDVFNGRKTAIRVFFEGWYDSSEDDFLFHTKFLTNETIPHDECDNFTREHKRQIGFLIYRDYRGLSRPITLEQSSLFGRLMQSQNVIPKNFEQVFTNISNVLSPILEEQDFLSLLNSYKAEFERYLPLNKSSQSALSFDLTDRTRKLLKEDAQLYSKDNIFLPLQKSGAGTRCLATLSMLTLIMRRRGRGILALEEPETFLFPHAQRRVIDECVGLSDQIFVTTHSPYVLERIPITGVGRIERNESGDLSWKPIPMETARQANLYSRYLKTALSEALVSRGVLIVEGESDRVWLQGVSRILNGKTWNSKVQEAFELIGISVVTASGNGEIMPLGKFFHFAGIKVICLFDFDKSESLMSDILTATFPSVIFQQNGIEKVLSKQLNINLLRKLLIEAPQSITPLLIQSQVDLMQDVEIRKCAFEMLKSNKGSITMHEWLINQVDENAVPKAIADIVDLVTQFIKETGIVTTSTILC